MTGDPDFDPGWRLSPTMLLFFVPGYLALTARRGTRAQADGLASMRQLWLSFTFALLMFGVVIALVVPGSMSRPAGAWMVALFVIAAAGLTAEEAAGRRPLDCSSHERLAATYRTRFFLRIAFSEGIALFAFVATFFVGRWWLYWLLLPFALLGYWRTAPTVAHLRLEQQRLHESGCHLSLVAALRTPPSRK